MIVPISDAADREYDYIICGGGTAGLVLAARLTEDAAVSVLVVEAGPANLHDPALLRPASYATHFGNPAYDWAHKTVPQKHALGQEFPWARGKGLGGSSAINFYVYCKPSKRDIDDLERLGNPGWNWDAFNQYMRKAEKFTPPSEDFRTKHAIKFDHWKPGTEGPILTSFPSKICIAEIDIQQTLVNAGLPLAADPYGGDITGAFFTPGTIDPVARTRMYATPAYYLPHAQRKNLTVVVSALVAEVTSDISGDELRATGVKILSSGGEYAVRARKEVIVSAGAIKTPQILELSGIGDKQILEKAGIPVKLDLPSVGTNVQEHIFGMVCWELKDDVAMETLEALRDPVTAAAHLELHKSGEGLYTLGNMGLAFAPLDSLSPNYEEIHAAAKARVAAHADTLSPGLRAQYEIMLRRTDDAVPSCELMFMPGTILPTLPDPTKKYITMGFAVSHPWSRGSIHVGSADPTVDPLIDPHYLEEEHDMTVLLEMAKFVRALADISPLKDIVMKEAFPGPDIRDDTTLAGFLKQTLSTNWHTCGSASMLPRDMGGVVDPQLKVYGTSNLRVADLSILPLQVAAHTISVVYGVAEKAADIIKAAT